VAGVPKQGWDRVLHDVPQSPIVSEFEAAVNEAKAMMAVYLRGNKPDMSTNDLASILVSNLLSYGWRPPVRDNE